MKPSDISARLVASAAAAAALIGPACGRMPPSSPDVIADGYGDLAVKLSDRIERGMRRSGTVGLSIALVDDQKVLWQQGFGHADKSRGVLSGADTVYPVASVTKLFTATAVMQLAERGLVDIDRPITDYLPEFRIRSRFPDARPITPRDLLTHHSGLPSDRFAGWAVREDLTEAEAEAALVAIVSALQDAHLARPPGQAFAYSNLGYSLLGALVARVQGRGYSESLEELVFAPLGMEDTTFRRAEVSERMARGYFKGKEAGASVGRDIPAGELHSSAGDLAKFMRMVLAAGRAGEHQVLRPETLQEMLRSQNEDVPLDLDFRIGLGWWLDNRGQDALGRTAGHAGDLPPYHATLLLQPDARLGVVVLSNSEESFQLVQDVAHEALRLALAVKGVEARLEPTPRRVPAHRERLVALGGAYVSVAGLGRVERGPAGLRTTLGGTPVHLYPRDDGRFGVQYRLLGVIPLPVAQLDVLSVSYHEVGGRRLQALWMGPVQVDVGERLAPQPPPSAPWDARLGRYEVTDPAGDPVLRDAELRWDEEAAQMVLEATFGALLTSTRLTLPLAPLTEHEAVTLGVGRNAGEILHFTGPDTFVFSGLVATKTP